LVSPSRMEWNRFAPGIHPCVRLAKQVEWNRPRKGIFGQYAEPSHSTESVECARSVPTNRTLTGKNANYRPLIALWRRRRAGGLASAASRRATAGRRAGVGGEQAGWRRRRAGRWARDGEGNWRQAEQAERAGRRRKRARSRRLARGPATDCRESVNGRRE
jgi:hypothetical protein